MYWHLSTENITDNAYAHTPQCRYMFIHAFQPKQFLIISYQRVSAIILVGYETSTGQIAECIKITTQHRDKYVIAKYSSCT